MWVLYIKENTRPPPGPTLSVAPIQTGKEIERRASRPAASSLCSAELGTLGKLENKILSPCPRLKLSTSVSLRPPRRSSRCIDCYTKSKLAVSNPFLRI